MHLLIIFIKFFFLIYSCRGNVNDNELNKKLPTVGVSILVRNKAHILPYFLTCLHNLNYPKDRMYIWIYSDYNEDKSSNIVQEWIDNYSHEYHDVIFIRDDSTPSLHQDAQSSSHWSTLRFKHIIALREKAIKFARHRWADYIFMLDADAIMMEPFTLNALINKNMTVVAPMLISDKTYSNFWCGMTSTYYYKRTPEYKEIYEREKIGCFKVPMVNSAVLIDLRIKSTDFLTYDAEKIKGYKGPIDDIITFAVNAQNHDIPLLICNDLHYGYITTPLEDDQKLIEDYDNLLNVKLYAISRGTPLPYMDIFSQYIKYPDVSTYNVDKIFMINLERRTERKRLMMETFEELGMNATLFVAVDGKQLDMDKLEQYSITFMSEYKDPYHERPMKAGEVGCFLSHYYIWKQIVEKGYGVTLVLEDDIYFTPFFRTKFQNLLNELSHLDWDFAYIGRKILVSEKEVYVTKSTVRPNYSYWTLGYLITERGAKKLIDSDPLSKLIPVDEFLPIMFDAHPNKVWSNKFRDRTLLAYSAAPLLVVPTHYTGEDGYISDTEDSEIIANQQGNKLEL